jgi:hypothetical protein
MMGSDSPSKTAALVSWRREEPVSCRDKAGRASRALGSVGLGWSLWTGSNILAGWVLSDVLDAVLWLPTAGPEAGFVPAEG